MKAVGDYRNAELVDAGVLKSTLTEQCGRICAADLKRAHAFIERNQALGKVVLAGFSR